VNDVMILQALVDKKMLIITEDSIRDALHLDDAEGVECLPNEEIFTELARMGYEKPSTKLTFYKVISTHTTKYTSLALTQKVFANMRRVGKGFSRVETPLFEGMIVAQEVADEGDAKVNVDDVPAVSFAAEGDVSAADDVVLTDVEEPSIPSVTPPTPPPQPSQDQPSTSQANLTPPHSSQAQPQSPQHQPQPSQYARLPMDLLQNLMDTCTTLTRRGMMIADMDADVDVTLKDVAADVKDVALKMLRLMNIMQDDEGEPAKLQEVVEVVTTTKLITKVVTVTSATLTAAAPTLTTAPSAARRRKGVVIRYPQETTTPSTIIHSEAKSKDKGKGILVEEPKPLKKKAQIEQDEKYARELEAELNKNIDWDEVIDHVQRKQKEDNAMDYFKRMTYDDIRLIFEKHFDSNVAFLQKTKEQMDEEDSRALKRLNESQEDKAAEKQKLDEEVEELKDILR
nr:hypothetical protein [Tanacetum cinerariifolium]